MFKREHADTHDILVLVNDAGIAEILPVQDVNDERILANSDPDRPGYAVPIGDVKTYTGRRGRVFFYNAPCEFVQDAQRIAALERSTVLRQITHYKREIEPPKANISMILLGIGVFIIILVALLGGK